MITKTTEYGSKITTIKTPDFGKLGEYTIRDAEGKLVASMMVSDNGTLHICGHNVEIINEKA